MAETSRFWNTTGVGDGPGTGFTSQHWYDMLRRLFQGDQEALEGVLKNVLNDLAVTGTASPVSVNTGVAMVYGHYYENNAALNVTVSTPAATTAGRIVLEADWTAQTVRAKSVQSASGVTTPPTLVQSAGTTWQISLATYLITSGGVITLTDDRSYCHFSTVVNQSMIDNDSVGNAQLRNSAALSVIGRSANSVGDPGDMVAGSDGFVLRRAGTVLAFGQVATSGITDLAVTGAKLGPDSVDDTKAGNRIIQFYRRQGGDSTDWNVAGSTTYTPGLVRMQAGVRNFTLSGGSPSENENIIFPVSFGGRPIVIVSMGVDDSNTNRSTVSILTTTVTGATITIYRPDNTNLVAGDVTIHWWAIGSEV